MGARARARPGARRGGRAEIADARVDDRSRRQADGPRTATWRSTRIRSSSGRRRAARRQAAARAPDPARGRGAGARVRQRPVGAVALLPLLLPAARADAGDARALHAVDYDREMALVAVDERATRRRSSASRATSEPRPGKRGVRRGRRRCVAGARRGADADGTADRVREGARPAAPRGAVLRSNRNMLPFSAALGFATREIPRIPTRSSSCRAPVARRRTSPHRGQTRQPA